MERSCKILIEISSVSQQVITAASKYADRKGSRCVPRAHFQLEKDMRRMSIACDALADCLGKSSLTGGAEFDVRLQDWLSTEEPRVCLETLTGMIKLLEADTSFWTMFNPWRGQPTQDRIKEAVDLLHSLKVCFHFLFSTMALDNEARGIQNIFQSQTQNDTERPSTHSRSLLLPVQPNIDIPDPPSQIGYKKEIGSDKRRGKRSEATLEEILGWLDGLSCAEKQDITSSLRQPDTCEWLSGTTQYKIWWNSESSSLWLRGKPGAGKSVLASSVIESLEKIQRKGGILAFYYCDFRNERSTHASEVFRSLLSQLLRQSHSYSSGLGSLLDDLVYAKRRRGATLNNSSELVGFISRAARLFAQRPLVIIDALDECKDIEVLLRNLVALQGHVRLFVTSRPLQVIRSGLSGFPSISMDDTTEELSADIALHVTRELATRRRLRDLDADIKTDIHATLCNRADGMFRWVECSIDTLNRCVTMREVHEALANLPEGLDETYERILRAIDITSREGKLALRALDWLVAALRPLKIQELMEGLSIDLEKRVMDFSKGPMHRVALLDACGSLVTYSEKTEVIILSHFSVKEYLIGELTCARLPMYHISWEQAHVQLVRYCMCYICISLNRLQEARNVCGTLVDASRNDYIIHNRPDCVIPVPQPLRDYVMDDAFYHFQHLGSLFSSVLHDIELLAHGIEQHCCMWDNICLSDTSEWTSSMIPLNWPISKHDLTLYVLVAFAPGSVLHSYFARPPKGGTNPLIYAAYFHQEEQARILLSRGAELSCPGWDINGMCEVLPIEVAAYCNDESMAALFLAEESPVPADLFGQLLYDEDCCHISTPIRTMLLNTDDFVEAVNDTNGLIPNLGSLRNHLNQTYSHKQDLATTVRRLIQVGIDSLNGNQSFRPGTLLKFVAKICDEDNVLTITKFLVEYHLAEYSEDILLIALNRGYSTLVQYLLSLGLSLPPDPLRIILDSIDEVEGHILGRPTSMIPFLIGMGVDVHARTKHGNSVLHVMLQSDSSEEEVFDIVKRLITCGCNLREANFYRDTALHIALRRGYLTIARHLHSLGVPLPSDPFAAALTSPAKTLDAVVRFLIDNGADATGKTRTPESGTKEPILHLALKRYARKDMLYVTKLLINGGFDPLQVDSSGQSTLHVAIQMGHASVVRYLFSLGIHLPRDSLDVLLQEKSYSTNTLTEKASLFRFLVENGADLHVWIIVMKGPVLHLALETFHAEDVLDIMKLLISSGCDPREADHTERTPLHIAIRKGHLSVVKYLHSSGIPLPWDSLCIALRIQAGPCPSAIQMLRFLINIGAEINCCPYGIGSPFHPLFRMLYPSAVLYVAKMLIESGCNPLQVDSNGQSPLHVAIQHGLGPVIRYYLSLGIPLPQDSLLVASRQRTERADLDCKNVTRRSSVVHLLIENGADVHARTAEGNNALHVALLPPDPKDRYKNMAYDEDVALEIAEVLVEGGCDPFQAPAAMAAILTTAIEQTRTFTAEFLIDLGIPVSPDALPVALQSSLYWGGTDKADMVHLLIDSGADVRARTANGDPVLHLVLRASFHEEDKLDIVEHLVKCGCSPRQVDARGRSAIQVALTQRCASVAQYLISIGVPPPPVSSFDVLLNLERWSGRPDASMVRFLVDHGARIRRCRVGGDSPFRIVLQLFDEEEALKIIELLVDNDCDPLQMDSSGDIPLYLAFKYRYLSVARYLWSIDPCNVGYDTERSSIRSSSPEYFDARSMPSSPDLELG